MGTPRDKDASRYYTAADHRRVDGRFLLEVERTTAAVYLSGYCVECVVKALILTQTPAGKRKDILDEFHATAAHNFDRLRSLYQKYGGPPLPKSVISAFVIVRVGGPDLRYEPAVTPADDAADFLAAVDMIWDRADGRL